MTRIGHVLVTSLVLAFVTVPAGVAAEEGDPKISTYYRVLIGRPDPAPGGASVVVVPGTVVLPGQPNPAAADDVLRVIDQLRDAYRLAVVEPAQSAMHAHRPGDQAKDVPSVAGGPQIQSTLLAFDATSATYRVTLTESGKLLAEPVVRVHRGGRAIVGSRDGDAAPYLFLLIEPFPPIPEGALGAEAGKGDVTLPKILEKTNPAYPNEARRARLEGVVLLQITVGPSGRVTDAKVLRGEPMGLSEAAVAAVNQWKWEPARNPKGEAVTVMMTLTIRFALR
jgi:TonB family protein